MMKAGDIVNCPHCGTKTVVKTEKIFSGWKVAGEKFTCAFCSGELADPEKENKAVPAASTARDKLAALLGTEVEKVTIDPGEGFRKGCRNCVHLLEHPFKLLCAVTQQEVDPMYECPEFVDRNDKKKESDK